MDRPSAADPERLRQRTHVLAANRGCLASVSVLKALSSRPYHAGLAHVRRSMNPAQTALQLSGNPRKQQLRHEIEASLDEIERWRKINAAYHADDLKFMRFLIPPGKRVLELGCGTGELLASLAPSHGVGIDFAQAPLDRARTRYPHLSFVLGDAEDRATLEQIQGPFDYIVIADTIGMW